MKGDVTMRIIITDSYRQMGREAANMVAGQLYLKPDSVLGLATGSTPLPHACPRISKARKSFTRAGRTAQSSPSASPTADRRPSPD